MSAKGIKTYSDLRLQGNAIYHERLALLESHLKVLDSNISEIPENRERLIEKIAYYKEEIQKIAD